MEQNNPQKQEKPKGWFKRILAKYDAFIKEIGMDNGACKSCVPIVKEDPQTGEIIKK